MTELLWLDEDELRNVCRILATRLCQTENRMLMMAVEMEKAVAVRLADVPGGAVLAGFVGALAAQVWTEITKHMKAQGPDADIDTALTVAMTTLKRLFA